MMRALGLLKEVKTFTSCNNDWIRQEKYINWCKTTADDLQPATCNTDVYLQTGNTGKHFGKAKKTCMLQIKTTKACFSINTPINFHIYSKRNSTEKDKIAIAKLISVYHRVCHGNTYNDRFLF